MLRSRLSYFTLISGGGWILDVVVLIVLVTLGANYFVANMVSATFGVTFVFTLAQRHVFASGREGLQWRLFLPYLCWQVIAISVASLLIAALAQSLFTHIAELQIADPPSPDTISAALAKILVTPLTLYANFLFSGWLMERRISWC